MKRIVKESYEVSPEIEQRLNSILADEFLAAEAYRLAIVAMKGNKQHRLEEIAEKNGEDELEDHFKNLYEWMQSKGIKVVTDRDEMAQITNGTILKFKDGMSTAEIVNQLILSEEEAIDIYEDTIPYTELDLNVMLSGFLKDEREHLKELVDCRDEMGMGEKSSIEDNEEVELDDEPEDETYGESVVNERLLTMCDILEMAVEPEEVQTVKDLYRSAMDAGRKTAIYELEDLLGDRANDKKVREILDKMKKWIDSGAHDARSKAISDGYARAARSGANLGD